MREDYRFEICLDSAESCARAQAGGADRVELCSALMEGGLTPSLGTIKEARKVLTTTGLFVIIRPRGGDFCYSDVEFEVMKHDLLAAKEAGADGLVVRSTKVPAAVFEAAVEATEEAILNSLCMAEDMRGQGDHFAPALPLDDLAEILDRHRSAGQRQTGS